MPVLLLDTLCLLLITMTSGYPCYYGNMACTITIATLIALVSVVTDVFLVTARFTQAGTVPGDSEVSSGLL